MQRPIWIALVLVAAVTGLVALLIPREAPQPTPAPAAPMPEAMPAPQSSPESTNQRINESTTLRLGVIRGCLLGVVSGAGQADVEVALLDQSGARTALTRTDASGEFHFEGLPAAPHVIGIIAAWPVSSEIVLTETDPEAQLTFRIAERLHIAGTAIDVDAGAPVPGVRLLMSGGGSELASAETGAAGQFRAEGVLVTSPWLTVLCDDPAWVMTSGAVSEELELVSAAAAQSLRILLRRGMRLDVLAVDPVESPLPGAELLLLTGDIATSRPLGVTDAAGHLAASRPEGLREAQIVGAHRDWPLLLSEVFGPEATRVIVHALDVVDLEVEVVDREGTPQANWLVVVTPRVKTAQASLSTPGIGVSLITAPQATTDAGGLVRFARQPRCEHLVEGFALAEEASGEARAVADLSSGESPIRVRLVVGETGEPHVTITGRVVSVSREPIEGARVFVDDGLAHAEPHATETLTDATGAFTLSGPAEMNAVTVRAAADGFAPSPPTRIFSDQANAEIVLRPAVIIRGRAMRRGGGAPTRFALMLWQPALMHWCAGWELGDVLESTSELVNQSTGEFEWVLTDLPATLFPGPIWLLALTDSGEVATADLTLGEAPGQTFDVGQMRLSRSLTLQGRVVDTENRPIPRAQIQWEEPRGWPQPAALGAVWRTESADDGRFTLTPLPEGHWRVGIQAEDHAPQAFEIDLPADVRRDFVLPGALPADFTVRVLDEIGHPFPGATTELRAQLSEWVSTAVTDANGDAVHPGTLPGPHHLFLTVARGSWQTWLRTRIDVVEQGRSHTVDLRGWPALAGRVTRRGTPAAGVVVTVEDDDQWTISTCRTDDSDFYRVLLPPGEYGARIGEQRWPVELTEDQTLDITLN